MKDRNQRNKQKKVTWRKQTLQEKKIFFSRNAAFNILREIRKVSQHETRTGYYFKRGKRSLKRKKSLETRNMTAKIKTQ